MILRMDRFENKIICGDCIEVLDRAPAGWADLIFADPPFNIGYQYDKYRDKLKSEKYISWTRDWMAACVRVLSESGSFYIAIGDDYAAHVRLIGEQLGLTLRNWIIWHYTFGQQTKLKFARAHTHIFYFIKDPDKYVFNDWAVRVPSDRQIRYNDRRANPSGKLPDDVWNEYSRVCGTFKERQRWHPCQMPETLLARIIAVSSNEGDLVLDPFNGSGTTTVTAAKLDRRYCGVELSENYAKNARQRIEAIETRRNGFPQREFLELVRLTAEMNLEIRELLDNQKLFTLFLDQYRFRLSGGKAEAPLPVQREKIMQVLKEGRFFD